MRIRMAIAVSASAVALTALVAVASDGLPHIDRQGRRLREITWKSLDYPSGPVLPYEARASEEAIVDGVSYDTEYVVVARSGDKFGGNVFGQLVDEHGAGLTVDGEPDVSNNNDFSSMLPRGKDDIYMVTHFESPEPEVVYFSKAKQDLETGEITIKHTEALDWSKYGGLWTPCAGSVTPWQSHLGSEEYEPDARAWYDGATDNATGATWLDVVGGEWNRYFNLPADATNADMAKVMYPYNYGYPWEVKVNHHGHIYYQTKHMAAGRLAIELAYVMPDNKTMYVTDDGDNVMFAKYVMSEPGNIECGTIYGAKFKQLDDTYGGHFTLEWIKVGDEACNSDFEHKAAKTTFYDLFDTEEIEDEEDPSCSEGYTLINAQPGYLECLKVKEGKELQASRFETRRLAAMKGVTVEWSKWEGITLDTKRYKIYTALSEVRRGMEDFGDEGEASAEFDIGGPNDVRLPWNPCGCVYQLDLDDKWSATEMYALVCGDKVGDVEEDNACSIDNIASPDNVIYMPGHDATLIGEDTGFHVNNLLWYYDNKKETLTSIFATPVEAEVTGPYFFPNIRGWSYIQAVAQHPLEDLEDLSEEQNTGIGSYLGYIGPFKARSDSVDMMVGEAGGRLWNDFPASGKKDMASGGGKGSKKNGHHASGKAHKHKKHGGKKHSHKHSKKHGKNHGKAHGGHKHMKKYEKPKTETSRKRSARHHSAEAKEMAHKTKRKSMSARRRLLSAVQGRSFPTLAAQQTCQDFWSYDCIWHGGHATVGGAKATS